MKTLVKFFVGLFMLSIAQVGFGQIATSAHDFSNDGWSGGQICIVCHTPHNATVMAEAPLWNHQLTTQTFTLYTSSTLDATLGQPDGNSKLCLSCHDGVTAIDNFGGVTAGTNFVTGSEDLGTDLSNDHPISFTYDATLAATDGELFDPSTQASGLGGTIDADLLFGGKLQCASCHDVHNGAGFDNLLVMSNAGSTLCLTCHDK